MSSFSLSQAARDAVVAYEAGQLSEDQLLAPCAWDFFKREDDPVRFVDALYGSLRRLESAAWKNKGNSHLLVQQASQSAKGGRTAIEAMLGAVERTNPATPLEEAGKEFLLDRLRWALGIITNSLPQWGY